MGEGTADLSTALPGFPVETSGSDYLHAALFTERRKRGYAVRREVENPGALCRKSICKGVHPHRDLSTALRSGRDDKGKRGALPGTAVAGQKLLFIALGEPKAHDFSGRKTFPKGKHPHRDLSAALCVERHFQETSVEPQVPPLCSYGAPVGMTRGKGWLFWVIAGREPFFITLGGRAGP
jgi:hypothetical protein